MSTFSSDETRNLGVVVGFDGSPHAQDALRWAARAAARRQAPLTVASAYLFPYRDYVYSMSPHLDEDPSHRIAETRLEDARELLDNQGYEGEVDYQALVGDATEWLVSLSERAQLVVVGRRGRGKFWGRVLGSVAAALPAHAHCPTVVVHSPDDAERTPGETATTSPPASEARAVCVGVDGSEHARNAAIIAAQEAKWLGVQLEVVQAQPYVHSTADAWYFRSYETMDQQIHEDALEFLTTEINALQQQVPDVEMLATVVRGIAAEAMIDCTERAQLTVLGTRGRGGFSSLLLGSVSRTTLAHARGTVMVVPTPKD